MRGSGSEAPRGWRGFWRDRRGVAAIEFAFIAPILMVLYFVTLEVSQGIETRTKVARTASMVGDLVAQHQTAISADDVEAIMEIAQSIMQPYQRSLPHITVSAIQLGAGASPQGTVVWSRRLRDGSVGQGDAVGSAIDVPEQQRTANNFLIRVTTDLNYRPVIAWSAEQRTSLGLVAAFDNIAMSERYFLSPRMSRPLNCRDC